MFMLTIKRLSAFFQKAPNCLINLEHEEESIGPKFNGKVILALKEDPDGEANDTFTNLVNRSQQPGCVPLPASDNTSGDFSEPFGSTTLGSAGQAGGNATFQVRR